MKKLIIILCALALPHFVWGQLILFKADLDSLQETPPHPDSPGRGTATATLNVATFAFTIDVVFTGLLAPETDAHIHTAPSGVPGPVTIPLPLGSPITFSTVLTPLQESNLLAGLWYVNIHSSRYPDGEIRGQLLPVPEPSTYGMVGAAALGALVYFRRRKSA